jgi:hypothetical protein
MTDFFFSRFCWLKHWLGDHAVGFAYLYFIGIAALAIIYSLKKHSIPAFVLAIPPIVMLFAIILPRRK